MLSGSGTEAIPDIWLRVTAWVGTILTLRVPYRSSDGCCCHAVRPMTGAHQYRNENDSEYNGVSVAHYIDANTGKCGKLDPFRAGTPFWGQNYLELV